MSAGAEPGAADPAARPGRRRRRVLGIAAVTAAVLLVIVGAGAAVTLKQQDRAMTRPT